MNFPLHRHTKGVFILLSKLLQKAVKMKTMLHVLRACKVAFAPSVNAWVNVKFCPFADCTLLELCFNFHITCRPGIYQ